MTRFLRGGAEEKTLLELENLGDYHQFTLATGPEIDPRSIDRARKAGVPHIVIPSLRHYAPWRAPAAIRQVRSLLRADRYDLVHTHSTEAGIIAREAARRERIPRIVHTIHGLEFADAHPYPIRRTVLALHRRLAPSTHRYFSNADVLTMTFLDHGIGRRDQYVTVRSAIDLKKIQSASAVALDGDPVVLTAGRLVPGKGMEEVLEAVGLLSKKWPGLNLYVVGEGPREAALRKQAVRLPPGTHIHFLGFREDLPGLLRGADAVVLASHREGTPRVLTEALAVGCPIVATNVDGIPEQVSAGRTGLLVAPRDAAALADALEETLGDPDAAKARARAGQRYAEEFGLPRMVDTIRREYHHLEAHGPETI